LQVLIVSRRNTVVRANAPDYPIRIKSIDGREIDIVFHIINQTADQMIQAVTGNKLREIQKVLYETAKEARENGAIVVGFGGFTSIAANNCKNMDEISGLSYTTGNSLTTGLGYKALMNKISEMNIDLSKAKAVVIGAAGNIGQVYSSLLTEDVTSLILLGSQRRGSEKRLQRAYKRIYKDIVQWMMLREPTDFTGVAKELYKIKEVKEIIDDHDESETIETLSKKFISVLETSCDPCITISTNRDVIKDADILICATNSTEGFIGNDLVKENTVICDLGVPRTIKDEIRERTDVEYLQGGLAKLPFGQKLDSNMMNVPDGFAYGCVTETIVLGFLNVRDHYSYGNIGRNQVKEITELAESLGFVVGDRVRETIL